MKEDEIQVIRNLIVEEAYLEAIQKAKDIILTMPTNNEAYFLLGSSYYLNNEFDLAIEILKILEKKDPNYNNLNKVLGDLYRIKALSQNNIVDIRNNILDSSNYYKKEIDAGNQSTHVTLSYIYLYMEYFCFFPFNSLFVVKSYLERATDELREADLYKDVKLAYDLYFELFQHKPTCMWFKSRTTLLSYLPPNGVVCEIGVQKGIFSAHILKQNSPLELHLIDCWEKQADDVYLDTHANISQEYHNNLYQKVVDRFKQEIDNNQVIIHRKFSTEAIASFSDHYFDWGYIDANHSYESVKADLESLYPKIKVGGYILGHDYISEKYVSMYGVVQAVDEFVAKHQDICFIGLTQEVYSTYILKKID